MDLFGATHGLGGSQNTPPLQSKISFTYSVMMKLTIDIPELKDIQKISKSDNTPTDFC